VESILAAAAEVFSRRGYAGTSTNHIAEQAGVSIGSLYQYFPSKEAILLALAERHVEHAFAAVVDVVREKRHAPVPVLIRALVDAVVEGHQVDPRLHRAIFQQTYPDEAFQRRLESLDTRAMTLAGELIEERCAELVVRKAETASFLVVQVLEGVAHVVALRHPETLRTAEFRSELARLLESYLTGSPR